MELKVVNDILYGNWKWKIHSGNFQHKDSISSNLFSLELGSRHKSSSIEEAPTSSFEVSRNGLIEFFLRLDLVKWNTSYIRKRYDPFGLGLIADNKLQHNPKSI